MAQREPISGVLSRNPGKMKLLTVYQKRLLRFRREILGLLAAFFSAGDVIFGV
jgi:hypothetical protein